MTIPDSDLDAIEAMANFIGNDPNASSESGESNRYIEWIFTDAEDAALKSVLSNVPRLVAEVRGLRSRLDAAEHDRAKLSEEVDRLKAELGVRYRDYNIKITTVDDVGNPVSVYGVLHNAPESLLSEFERRG